MHPQKLKSIPLKGSRVLVTGGAGAIGSNLVERLVQSYGCDVTVVDDYSQGHPSNLEHLLKQKEIEFIQGDINHPQILQKAFSKDVDVIYHLAASFANELSVEDPIHDLECNIKGTLNLLKAGVKAQIKLFVYASSSSLYGPRDEILLNENLFPNPSTPYAVSKLTGEFYCKSMKHLYDQNFVALRFSNTYGPKDFPGRYRNVIPNFMRKALKNEPLTITGTGGETRDYTYIDDCLDGILLASQKKEAYNQTFNLGTGKPTRTIDLAKSILKMTGSKSKIQFLKPRYFDHIKYRMMDITKASKTFGYRPQTSIEDGLEKTFAWVLGHKEDVLKSAL